MKVTQNAGNGIFESLDFQNFLGSMTSEALTSFHIHLHQIFVPLSFIEIPLTEYRRKKKLRRYTAKNFATATFATVQVGYATSVFRNKLFRLKE